MEKTRCTQEQADGGNPGVHRGAWRSLGGSSREGGTWSRLLGSRGRCRGRESSTGQTESWAKWDRGSRDEWGGINEGDSRVDIVMQR